MSDELTAARDRIAQLTAENARLQRELEGEHSARDLRHALVLAATAGTIGSPVSHERLLELIVETAAHVINARAAHLFLIDQVSEELVFVVAVGPHVGEIEERRVPLSDAGLAGLVAFGGQPMNVADAGQNPTLASWVAQFLGYVPHSILCVPLFVEHRVIGVIELLDKEGDSAFTNHDLADLSLFANQAAVAIAQSRTHQNLAALVGDVLLSLESDAGSALQERAQAIMGEAGDVEDVDFREALELAQLVREIAWHGQAEYRACLTILRGLADYLRARPKPKGLIGGDW